MILGGLGGGTLRDSSFEPDFTFFADGESVLRVLCHIASGACSPRSKFPSVLLLSQKPVGRDLGCNDRCPSKYSLLVYKPNS
jgi:hypothetical protein